ncbi:MAG: FAD-binding oxidoreductase [Verrucomicrobia bacterium]|nr:FAD-binding oxidoreductase [Verrucomicrobiota bacterium]
MWRAETATSDLTGASALAMIRFRMILQPRTVEELQRAVAAAYAGGERIASVQLGALNRLVDHVPEDMTATVEAGMTLTEFQDRLTSRGQWLPVDPPNSDRLSIGQLLSAHASGPRRFGYGTVRDYLIGMKVVLADGRVIKSGGKVVKNVAGYDLCKLFIGSHGTLGVIVEATFKLRPVPEAEQFVQIEFDSLEKADAFVQAILESDLVPVALDLHNLPTNMQTDPSPRPSPLGEERVSRGRSDASRARALTVVLGFAGAREDVEYQLGKAAELGARSPSNLDHETKFWDSRSSAPARRLSVLPSELTQAIRALGQVPFVARAGNGVVWHRGGPEQPKTEGPERLLRRVKDTFDPKHIFPDLPL